MGKNIRNSGIDTVGDIPWGTHICQFYQTKEDLLDILLPYFIAGLKNNELCLWVTSQPLEVEEAKKALKTAVSDIDVYLGKGQLEIISYACWYANGESYFSESTIDNWIKKLNHPLTSSYEGLRFAENTSWLKKENWEDFNQFVNKINKVFGKHPMIALRSYFLSIHSTIEIIDAVSNHQSSLIKKEGKWECIENFERRKMEEASFRAAKEAEFKLKEVQRRVHIGNWDWDLATDSIHGSEEIYRIFGCSYQNFDVSCNEALNCIHADDKSLVGNAVKAALNGEPLDIDYRIISAKGEERIVHTQGEVVLDEKNTPIRMRGTLQDITEYKKTENALELSEERYHSFIQNFTGIAFQLDQDFNLQFLKGSVEEITGYTEDELMNKELWSEIIEKEDLPIFLEKGKEIINSPSPYCGKLSYRIRCKDGKMKWVHEVCQKIPGKKGKPDIYQGTIADVTERIKAKEALVKFENARKKEIHHRIKNNLQVISSLLDLQVEKFSNKRMAPTTEILEAFRESKNRVISMSLIHEELHKGEGTDTLEFTAYLRKLAENLFQTYSLNNRNIHLCMDLEENAFFNMDTAIPLGIIVNELVSNSLKHAFTGKDGEILIRLCKEEENNEINKSLFSLTISDNGKGIPDNIELENVESLGMRLVSTLVDQLDGKIELKRLKGTEIRITFRVAKDNNEVKN
jgi:two-component system, sensor histidine kinase PdtaS